MLEVLAAGKNIYYRGYLIDEDIRAVCYTIYGVRPQRAEMASVRSSQEAMQWIDRRLAEHRPAGPAVWPDLFARPNHPSGWAS